MSSRQRRRGTVAVIYRSMDTEDRRGNTVRVWDQEGRDKGHARGENPYRVRVVQTPQRSAKAEVPGQQAINVTRLIIPPGLEDIDLYSRVEWNGKVWDVVTPPSYHHGTKHTRHDTIDLRQRPA